MREFESIFAEYLFELIKKNYLQKISNLINHKYKYEREVGCRSEDGGGQRGNAQNSAKLRLKWLDRFEEITQAPLKNMDSIPAPHRPKASR